MRDCIFLCTDYITMSWIERSIGNPNAVQELSDALNSLPPPLARVLILRGIDSLDAARAYFRGTREDLYSPHLLAEMDHAAQRIAQAITKKEKVLVYGDFDADGVTSTALVLRFLQSHEVPTAWYIPHRVKENHGFHTVGVDEAKAQECSLIIVVDCGTNGEESAAYARDAGIELIICDHHQNEGRSPVCHAHVNPNRESCTYPQKDISACVVAYKMVQATLEVLGHSKALADQYLDLVAISTVCDVMPLKGENRILVRDGLEHLRACTHPGLRELISVSKCVQERLTAADIAMQLGPRLNAAGRLAHAREALDVLMTSSEVDAKQRVQRLNELNESRKVHGSKLHSVAGKLAQVQLHGSQTSALVLHHEEWHPGILGPAAAQMVREFSIPAVMLTDVPDSDGKEVFGSARTWGDVDILEAMYACQDLLTKFGGHAASAGLSLRREDIQLFRERFNAEVGKQIKDRPPFPPSEYDARLSIGEISGKFERVLRLFQPFGKGNEAPLFLVENVHPVSVRLLSGGKHLKMQVRETDDSRAIDAIGFHKGHHHITAEEARVQKSGLDFLCYVEENWWNGRVTMQLRIEALRPHIRS